MIDKCIIISYNRGMLKQKLQKRTIMKNTIKVGLTISTFAILLYIGANETLASGAYGSDVVLKTVTTEVHKPVDAGLADMLPQLGTAFAALSGLVTTSVLLKKK